MTFEDDDAIIARATLDAERDLRSRTGKFVTPAQGRRIEGVAFAEAAGWISVTADPSYESGYRALLTESGEQLTDGLIREGHDEGVDDDFEAVLRFSMKACRDPRVRTGYAQAFGERDLSRRPTR